MTQLLCAKCGETRRPGRRQILAATASEPAEWERVIRGPARVPTAEQRVIKVNGRPIQLVTNVWDCDQCEGTIAPNDIAVAWTVWAADQPEPESWEGEYLQ